MLKIYFVITISQVLCLTKCLTGDHLNCLSYPNTKSSIQISFHKKINETGSPLRIIKAETFVNKSIEQINLKLNHTTLECEGRTLITIEAIYDPYDTTPREKLLFYQRCGKNVEILNQGRTVVRKRSGPLETVVFTNRPLYNDEIFEVILEERESNSLLPSKIGVITELPENITILSDMNTSSDAILYFSTSVISNGQTIKNYGKNTGDWKEGDRLGVMKSTSGKLYFFYNGENLGEAAIDLPPIVYGMFELFGKSNRASIFSP